MADDKGKYLAVVAKDTRGHQVICVLVKRTYDICSGGKVRRSDEQMDFVYEDQMVAKGTEPGWYPVAEAEIVPYKLNTDIIVTGDVVAPAGKKVTCMDAGIIIGDIRKDVKVFGNRIIEMTAGGKISFSEPQPFVSLPMTYSLAYGGVDPSVPRNENPRTVEEWVEYLTLERHPGVYPRNPVGQAYVVNKERWLLNGRPLPNFEDPEDLLTPDRIVVGDPKKWWQQPMPAGLGWFGKIWYPRCVHSGLLPPYPPDQSRTPEVRKGLLASNHVDEIERTPIEEFPRYEFFNGASPGLAEKRVRGDEPVKIVGMDPSGMLSFELPGERPDVSIQFEGKELEIIDYHIHTVWIKTDKKVFSMVWSVSARPPKRLPLELPTRENPMYDELKGVDIYVDGCLLPHEEINACGYPVG